MSYKNPKNAYSIYSIYSIYNKGKKGELKLSLSPFFLFLKVCKSFWYWLRVRLGYGVKFYTKKV